MPREDVSFFELIKNLIRGMVSSPKVQDKKMQLDVDVSTAANDSETSTSQDSLADL